VSVCSARSRLGEASGWFEQGERGDSLYLLLDDVLQIEVDSEPGGGRLA
jgi:hypothetical protein